MRRGLGLQALGNRVLDAPLLYGLFAGIEEEEDEKEESISIWIIRRSINSGLAYLYALRDKFAIPFDLGQGGMLKRCAIHIELVKTDLHNIEMKENPKITAGQKCVTPAMGLVVVVRTQYLLLQQGSHKLSQGNMVQQIIRLNTKSYHLADIMLKCLPSIIAQKINTDIEKQLPESNQSNQGFVRAELYKRNYAESLRAKVVRTATT
ncbi:hypothetical protein ACJX0J_032525 [Zea mays]